MRTMRMVVSRAAAAMLMFSLGVPLLRAQMRPVPPRVTGQVDDTRTLELKGNIHPLARPEFDRGAVADSQPMTRMLLLLQRSDEQERALQQLMDEQQTKGSANYHAWLTPEQFGRQFGPSDADIQAVTDWLTRQGFQIAKVAAGRNVIEFSGTVAQVRNAFHTEIHKFAANGAEHMANVSEPAIPEALAPVVKGVVALHNFPKVSHLRNGGIYRRIKATGELQPLFTYEVPAKFALGPGDWRTVYNVPPNADGSGQSIAIVGQSNINITDVQNFRTMFGLPANDPQIIVNGPDPGLQLATGDEQESDLDVEWAGAIAPKAQIIFVTSESTQSNPAQVSAGIDLSALYIVDNHVAPVMSESYGACEVGLLTAGNAFYNQLWEQAAAQGISVTVSTGDTGSAGCDSGTANEAKNGLAVSGIASTPFNVAVGGTDFDPTTTAPSTSASYWTQTSGTINSALKYMPETTWNDSHCAFIFPSPCTSVDRNGNDLAAASGGPSSCILGSLNSSNNVVCNTNSTFPNGGYTKPPYQNGITPADAVRDQPDISFFASNGENNVAIVVCESDANPDGMACDLNSPFQDFTLLGGTSAGTPAFAAVMALVNQSQVSAQNPAPRQGNPNYVLYGLANNATYTGGSCNASVGNNPTTGCVYNDVTKGNNSVACAAGTPNCSNQGSSGFGVLVSSSNTEHGNPAFQAVAGYDLATGLGSINVANLLSSWNSVSRMATTTTVSSPSGGSPSGTTFTASVSVTPAGATGDVSFTALKSDAATVLGSFGPFPLSGGNATVTTNLLPAGTAFVSATYGGDATHAGSTSSPPLAFAGTPAGFNSQTVVSLVTFDANNNPTLHQGSQQITYGQPYILQIAVSKSDGTSCSFGAPSTKPAIPCPTGKITLAQNGSPSADFPSGQTNLNNNGVAEDQPISVSATLNGTTPAVYNFMATYGGDPNYSGSTSAMLTLSVSKASTTMSVSSSLGVTTSTTSVTLTAVVNSTSNTSQGPTGNVQFQNGSANLGSPVPCTPAAATATAGASCTATLTTTLSALYPPTVRDPRPTLPLWPLLFAALSIVLFALGLRWMPEKRRRVYATAGFLAFALLAAGIAGCGGGGGSNNGGHTVTVKATYAGDANYAGSSGKTPPITIQ